MISESPSCRDLDLPTQSLLSGSAHSSQGPGEGEESPRQRPEALGCKPGAGASGSAPVLRLWNRSASSLPDGEDLPP